MSYDHGNDYFNLQKTQKSKFLHEVGSALTKNNEEIIKMLGNMDSTE
jgi:hypothetical protein